MAQIINGQYQITCLGGVDVNGAPTALFLGPIANSTSLTLYDISTTSLANLTWSVYSIAGTRSIFLMMGGSALSMDQGNAILLPASTVFGFSDIFALRLDEVSSGIAVAINSHDGNVLDAHPNYQAGCTVAPYSWNGNTNQQWRFVPVAALPPT